MPYPDTTEILRQTAGMYHADTPEVCIGLLPVNDAELEWVNRDASQRYGVIAQPLQVHQLESAYVSQADQCAAADELTQREASAERAAARRFARVVQEAGFTAMRFIVTPANGHDARNNYFSFQIALEREFPGHASRYAELCLRAAR